MIHLASVVQMVDYTIHWINLYPWDNTIGFCKTYLVNSDLSTGWGYPMFQQLGPGIGFSKDSSSDSANYCYHYYHYTYPLYSVSSGPDCSKFG